ncbi:PREDICTED: LOW QUALITY PROTEIN: proline-rich extensin-like protein EPR1 [Habropoda laboriosa]|uniref:LOW QUALITY PROTEIN: proline-rich extensin-like protein EPR1 n=1 Tax=Habropoda laboriosa TaxID=597456 RepID=UPI00083DFE38|nr:PREDICTED: LOW QUALITY PROTEIN: proline-rich extensin-like protein EPR1 [Habropoda laboriosa]
MLRCKITITLLCVLLIGHNVHAVVNKAQPQVSVNKDEEKPKNGVQADDRISNSYGPPADDYGPPIGSSIKGPAPVYGPPELVGDQGPTPIYPPPPPDVPPPVYGPPLSSYGPPRNIKPLHGPPKQSFGPPLSPLPLKLSFGPLKLHYGPPKQHYGPPYSFGSFRPPKPQYGPPLKFTSAVSNQYIASGASNHGPTKPTHGPVIPVSLDTYGPPPQKLVVQLNSQASDNYGPPLPLSISPLPEAQYGPPTGDLFRLPSPVPPPGVPAPPTPPDIKYDGWQPIAGLSNQHRQPGINYGPPHEEQKIFDVSSVGLHLGQQVTRPVVENPNVPSDSYGTPIHHPEAQDLKSSVNSDANGDRGLPPPPLPEYEPFHNESPPKKEAHKETVTGQVNLQYEVPNVAPLSIVKTIGFELPPTTPSLTTDLSVGSLASLKLPLLSSESHVNFGDTHALQNLGNDLSLSQLSGNTLPSSYGSPLSSVSFVKLNNIESGIPLPPPPVLDSYSSPPLSSYSPNGPYPAAEAGRASSYSSFGLHGNSLYKQNVHHHRPHGSFRSPPAPFGSLVPPRNREPVKFKETIPSGLYTAFNRYLPPPRHFELTKSPKTYLPPLSLEQQLPIVNVPIAFNKLPSASLNSPIAAPNAQYGTPLSFGDFNTPAPVLTYGAPNFGPASSFISTSTGIGNNLYNSIGNAITTTYGTPVVNLPLSTGGGHDCGFQQTAAGAHYSFEDTGSHAAAVGSHGPSFGASLSADLNQNSLLKVESLADTLGGLGFSQPVSQLSLQNYDQPKANLKDSYGSPIGITILSSDHSQATDIANILSAPPAALPKESFSSGIQFDQNSGIRAEALTSSLTNQGFAQAKNLGSNELDTSQFLNAHGGNEFLTLAKGLSGNDADGFEIQGSKGTYTLKIQPADGGLGTENSDGSIRHDQVLSNGLLQDILAAIEQPEQGQVQLQGHPEAQSLQHVYSDLPQAESINVPKGHYITLDEDSRVKNVDDLVGHASDRSEAEFNKGELAKKETVALFFNNQYDDSRKETRSVTKVENVPSVSLDDGKNVSQAKSS